MGEGEGGGGACWMGTCIPFALFPVEAMSVHICYIYNYYLYFKLYFLSFCHDFQYSF